MTHKAPIFTVKKLVLTLVITSDTMSIAYVVLTAPTGSIWVSVSVLSSSSNNAVQVVVLSSNATGATLSAGDTITQTYNSHDAEGDADNSMAHVKWDYVKEETETLITTGITTDLTKHRPLQLTSGGDKCDRQHYCTSNRFGYRCYRRELQRTYQYPIKRYTVDKICRQGTELRSGG
ncbi:hypothetical protein D3C73_243660 [compost metagenome]|jgi:hypothetical protein